MQTSVFTCHLRHDGLDACQISGTHHEYVARQADKSALAMLQAGGFFLALLWWEGPLLWYFHVLLPKDLGLTHWRLLGGEEDSSDFMISWSVSMDRSNELCYTYNSLVSFNSLQP